MVASWKFYDLDYRYNIIMPCKEKYLQMRFCITVNKQYNERYLYSQQQVQKERKKKKTRTIRKKDTNIAKKEQITRPSITYCQNVIVANGKCGPVSNFLFSTEILATNKIGKPG